MEWLEWKPEILNENLWKKNQQKDIKEMSGKSGQGTALLLEVALGADADKFSGKVS